MSGPRPPIDLESYLLSYPEAPLVWSDVFGDDHPVEFEIGPGKGLFLANAAATHPERNFIGVEMAKKYAKRAAERVAKLGLTNVRSVAGDGREFLARFVPGRSLHAVHVYFPDPWWKKRHRKRRVFTAEFVDDAARALVPGGTFHLATDVEEYFGVMAEIMTDRSDFAPRSVPELHDPAHDLDYLTNFERKYRIEGRPIYRASYQFDPPEI